ncbi:unnamed protein product [marine sediment metagenome]|uniref:Uncharacterized protein n=1 Tax=marine sediment metagenome TaxID=412755 RepID=X0W5X3_9ZZZZ
MTETEIKATYLELHNQLEQAYYQRHELTKDEFDTQHGQVWADMDAALIAAGYRQPPEIITPPVFTPENHALGVDQRVSHIERFLESMHPPVI